MRMSGHMTDWLLWFTDEDGVQREGYVAKRNLKIIKEPEAEETEEKLPPEE